MRRRLRTAGWLLLALAALSVAVVVPVGAMRANGAAEFNLWVGWATVAAVPIAAMGVVLVLWDKVAKSNARVELSAADVETELAAVVLAQSQILRSRLIGIDEAGDQAANVRYIKATGRFREVGGAGAGTLASILEYYQSLSPARLVILGDPGAGKTVLSLELLIRLLEWRQNDPNISVPILISASAYDTNLPWEEWLTSYLAQRFGLGIESAARLVRDGRILPLVDGLDEMDPRGDPERARVLVDALNSSMRGRQRAAVVVTCRDEEYQVIGKSLDKATHIEMIPMAGSEVADYLMDQFLDEYERHLWEPVVNDLRANPYGPLASQVATPWRSTLALTVFRESGDPLELLPKKGPDPPREAAEQYAHRIDMLLLGRYVPAKVRLHNQDGRYTVQQVQRWLTNLADGLAWQSRHDRSATDIQLDQWWRISNTGQWVVSLMHMVVVSIFALPWFVVAAVTHHVSFTLSGSLILIWVLVAAFPAAAHRLAIGQLYTRRVVSLIVEGLLFGLVSGIIFGLLYNLLSGLVYGTSCALVGTFLLVLSFGLEDSSPQARGPRDLIQADGYYGLVTGLAYMLGGGLVIGIGARIAGVSYWLVYTLAFGISFGFANALSYGAWAWVRYHISVLVAAIRGSQPVRFGSFLDWAQRSGLLRLSGIDYQFRHRQLQDFLTNAIRADRPDNRGSSS